MTNPHPDPKRRHKISTTRQTSNYNTTPFLTFHFLTSLLATSIFQHILRILCPFVTSIDRKCKLGVRWQATCSNEVVELESSTLWYDERPQITANDKTINKHPSSLNWDSGVEIRIPSFSLQRTTVRKIFAVKFIIKYIRIVEALAYWTPGRVVIFTHCSWKHITDRYCCLADRTNDFAYLELTSANAFSLCFLLLTVLTNFHTKRVLMTYSHTFHTHRHETDGRTQFRIFYKTIPHQKLDFVVMFPDTIFGSYFDLRQCCSHKFFSCVLL